MPEGEWKDGRKVHRFLRVVFKGDHVPVTPPAKRICLLGSEFQLYPSLKVWPQELSLERSCGTVDILQSMESGRSCQPIHAGATYKPSTSLIASTHTEAHCHRLVSPQTLFHPGADQDKQRVFAFSSTGHRDGSIALYCTSLLHNSPVRCGCHHVMDDKTQS